MARDPRRSKPQADVLYQIFILEKRHKLEAVAARMGIGASTFYGWVENEATLPAWAIPMIWDATQDVDLFARLTGAAERHMRVEAPAGATQPATPSHAEAALAFGAEVGDVLRDVRELGRDGVYDASDKAQLAAQIAEAKAKLEELEGRFGIRSVQ
jgi:hypothetical protein